MTRTPMTRTPMTRTPMTCTPMTCTPAARSAIAFTALFLAVSVIGGCATDSRAKPADSAAAPTRPMPQTDPASEERGY